MRMECPLEFSDKLTREIASTTICPSSKDEFLKTSRFSPDGSTILTSSESNYIGLWKLDHNITKRYLYFPIDDDDDEEMLEFKIASDNRHALTLGIAICVGDSIYDFSWYPFMNNDNPISCCFVSTSRDHPVHLWDSNTGLYEYKKSYFSYIRNTNFIRSNTLFI
jgi:WD40 repeat protein